MNKQQLNILEKAYIAEISSSAGGGINCIQSKSKVAKKLADDGYLERVSFVIGGGIPVKVEGYQITHAGIMAYCESCDCGID